MRTRHVLLVEDEPTIRSSFTRFLEGEGYQVHTACNVGEALDALAQPESLPDAVVLDVILPNSGGKSGLDVLEFLRQAQRSAHIPVIVWTGYPLSDQTFARIRELRAELVHKPVMFNDLLPALARLIERPEAGAGPSRPETER